MGDGQRARFKVVEAHVRGGEGTRAGWDKTRKGWQSARGEEQNLGGKEDPAKGGWHGGAVVSVQSDVAGGAQGELREARGAGKARV